MVQQLIIEIVSSCCIQEKSVNDRFFSFHQYNKKWKRSTLAHKIGYKINSNDYGWLSIFAFKILYLFICLYSCLFPHLISTNLFWHQNFIFIFYIVLFNNNEKKTRENEYEQYNLHKIKKKQNPLALAIGRREFGSGQKTTTAKHYNGGKKIVSFFCFLFFLHFTNNDATLHATLSNIEPFFLYIHTHTTIKNNFATASDDDEWPGNCAITCACCCCF